MRTKRHRKRLLATAFWALFAVFAPAAEQPTNTWWSLRLLQTPEVPAVQKKGWARTPIDRFILAKLEQHKLRPSEPADKRTLLRRVYFDLIGLPPTPQEIQAFLEDRSPQAYERVVDALLGSPRYGERWARYWLDIAHYAETHGHDQDRPRTNSWPYRDYVVQSFNEDKPYPRFVEEQIAGDVLYPDDPQAIVAMGFLATGPWDESSLRDIREDVIDRQVARYLDRDDIVTTAMNTFVSSTVQCARCHDHKFDPLLQRDYFRLQAFFAPLQWPESTEAVTAAERAEWQNKQAAWEAATAEIRAEIEAIEQRHRENARKDAASKFPPETQAIMAKSAAERTPAEQPLFDLAWRQVTYEWARIDTRIKGAEKEKIVALRKQLGQFDNLKPPPLPGAIAARDMSPAAPPVTIPKHESEGPVEAGVPIILDPAPAAVQAVSNSTGRRSALAKWIASPANPLTARVMVNRVWQQHFGRGLSSTTSDFGTLGEKPSHPALLDWLARRFMAEGWQLKKIHRLIVTSAAWRQSSSSTVTEHARIIDPENRLLWRWNTRRMDSEQIRDTIFAATGELDLTAGGPGVDATKPRRAVYVKVLRNVRDPLADVFDSPQHFNSTPTRDTTTTATQSLLLANSRFLIDRAETMAKSLAAKVDDDRALIEAAWQAATGRQPVTDEMEDALAFLKSQQESAPAPSSEFIADSMPQRDGKAAVLSPGTSQERLVVSEGGMALPDGDFSIETVVLLRSVFSDARVRTVVSQWNGDRAQQGWALGVTGQQSRRKPQTPVLQLIGRNAEGRIVEEPVFSDIVLQMDRSYYIAAAVHPDADGKGTVTFFVKDLANDDEPLQTAVVPHPIVEPLRPAFPLVIGDSEGRTRRLWDGLVDEVRIRRGCITEQTLSLKSPAVTPDTVACWQFEPATGFRSDSVSKTETIRATHTAESTARESALTDFCHSLLSSSALLYVE